MLITKCNQSVCPLCSWEKKLGPKQLQLLGVDDVRVPAAQSQSAAAGAVRPKVKLSPIMPLVRHQSVGILGMRYSLVMSLKVLDSQLVWVLRALRVKTL